MPATKTPALHGARQSRRGGLAASAYLGTWEVRRRVVDHLARTTAIFTGQASITRTRFEEAGQLAFGGATLNATRAYGLRFDPHSVGVAYPDGSAFIELQSSAVQTVRHQCGADLYVGRFFFLDADTWVEAWRVSGPRKGYASLSRYRRLAR